MQRARATIALTACALLCALPATGATASAATMPSASTANASGVTYSSAVLHGVVNPEGAATSYFFEYGTSRAYGAQSPLAAAGSGTAAVKVSQAITGLQAVKTYHYRLVVVGPGGAIDGVDRTFTTPKIPLSIAIVGVPSPVVFGNPFTVEGTLSGTDGPNHAIQLQANRFPYLGGFADVGNPVITGPTGGFSLPFIGLLETAQLRVVTVGNPPVTSPVFVERVAVRVTLHARATRRRGFARLYGTVAPAQVGSLVGFQLLRAGHRSSNVGGTVVKAGSRFSRVVRVRRGLYEALVQVTDGAHVSGYSAPVLIR